MSNQYDGGVYRTSSGSGRGPIERGPAPPSVRYAVWLMFVRPALVVVGLAVGFASRNTLRADVLKRSPRLDAAQVDAAVALAVTFVLLYGIAFLVIYVLLAVKVKKGKRWARIVTFALVSLGLFGNLLSFFRTAPAISHAIIGTAALLDVGIIVLLAQRRSARYFNTDP
jgi:hypothetical protein